MVESILVTDGDQRSALALVRAYGRAGHRVFVGGQAARTLAGASRYAVDQARLPDPLSAPEAYVAAIAEWSKRWGCTVVIPVTEASLLAVLGGKRQLDGVLVPFPDLARFSNICDKAAVLRAAEAVGISVPRQVAVPAPEAAADAARQWAWFPAVVKPGRSVAGGPHGRIKHTVRYASDSAGLAATLAGLPPTAFPVLLQQRVVGPGQGVFLLRHEGRTVASFAHRRLREKPPSGGVSVYSESVALSPGLRVSVEALLERLQWDGVAMVEFKMDAATETPYLMEINGRFWGSLQLAVDAGVDFPNLLLACARGAPPPTSPAWRTGLRLRWWWGEVDHLLARVRRSDAQLHLPPGGPGRWRAIGQVVWPWHPGDRPETFRLSDPMPFLRESLDWFRGR